MPVRTPEPRLPLEPEEYPLYKPPSRIGCSAMTLVALITVVTFAFLLSRVTPNLAAAIVSVPRNLLTSNEEEPVVTPGAGGMPTQTAVAALPTDTPAVEVPPTPAPEFVKVANTGGVGVRLRTEPNPEARSVVTVDEGATFQIIGPDVTNASGTWRQVELPGDGRRGYVLSRFLVAAGPPNP